MTSSQISHEICIAAVSKYMDGAEFQLIHCEEKRSDASLGLWGTTLTLVLTVSKNGDTQVIQFFVKKMSENRLQRELALKSRCFFKESEFFKMSDDFGRFFRGKPVPKCYYPGAEIIIMEDLAQLGYKNQDLNETFDVDQCKAALRALAEVHAAWFLYEREKGQTMDQLRPDLMFLAWFSDDEDAPGYHDVQTGTRALSEVLNVHFKHVPPNVRTAVADLLLKTGAMMRPSKTHKNVISHADLWCNNIMFNAEGLACLVDFQMYSYNPPGFDVLALIHQNTRKVLRDDPNRIEELVNTYYQELRFHLESFRVDPDQIFTEAEFRASLADQLPVALTFSALCLHTVLVPEEDIQPILENEEKFLQFMIEDRNALCLNAVRNQEIYRNRVFEALMDLIAFVDSDLDKSEKNLTR